MVKTLKQNNFFSLVCILVFGFIIRTIFIDALPATLNPDEAALGYNAYSILKTGKDEHGVLFPLALESFGDWKLPIYSYFDAISLAFLGVSKLSVRFPSIAAGTAAILLIYFVAKRIFSNRMIALLAALFLALNPWSIFFSRGAYEVNVATTLFLGGILAFLSSIEFRKKWYLFLSALLFGFTMFTQHNYILFAPLFVIALILIFRRGAFFRKSFFLFLIPFLFLATVAIISLTAGGGEKASNLNIFNDKNIVYNRAEKLRGDASPKNPFIEKILYNKLYAVGYQFTLNYLNAYSPNVLFDKGGERLTHNLGDVGYFYLFDAFLLISGIAFLLWKRDVKILVVLLPWLLLAPIPSAITREHTGTRLFTMVLPLVLISSYGAYQLITRMKKGVINRFILSFLFAMYLVSVFYFLEYYFVHFNTQRARFWKYGYEDVVKLSQQYPDYSVVMRGPENFPYIYFLLYNKYDPDRFRREVTYYPKTVEGFLYVKKFGKYQFVEKIDYSMLTPKTIYVDDVNLTNYYPAIRLPSREVVFKYYINK